jgi:hypothetical protein
MIFNEKLSRMMSRAIKANTTTTEREGVAALHDMSIHTLNSVINMQRNVAKSNAPALIDIIRIAIENANRCGVSLTRYAEMAKAAEAAQSNETKQKAN